MPNSDDQSTGVPDTLSADDDNLFLDDAADAAAPVPEATENLPFPIVIACLEAVIANQFRRQLLRVDATLDVRIVGQVDALIDTLEDHPKFLLIDPQLLGADGAYALPQIRDGAPEASILLLPCGPQDLRRSIADLVALYGLKCLGVVDSVSDREGLAEAVRRARDDASPKANTGPGERLTAAEVREGLAAGALMLFYQPQVKISDGSVIGFEALARWRRGEEILGPDAFIHTAENEGIIHELTRVVVSAAAEQLGDWLLDGRDTHISVNVTADDLEDPTFVSFVRRTVEAAGVPPSSLVIEVTERRLANNLQQNQQSLTALKSAGFPLAIDDYGTGYSSLEQLHRMPLDELKIDRAFVHDAWKVEERKVILNSSVAMGLRLGLRVIAEGVETEKEWALLGSLQATAAQGYFVGRPMPADAIDQWEQEWHERKPDPLPEVDDVPFLLERDIRDTRQVIEMGQAADARHVSPYGSGGTPAELERARASIHQPGYGEAGTVAQSGINGPGRIIEPEKAKPVVAETILDHIRSGIINRWTIWGGALVLLLEVVLVAMNFWSAVNEDKKLPTLADSGAMAVAVLPFKVTDTARGIEDGWSESLAEELITLLTKSDGLQVAGRTSSLSYLKSNVSAVKFGQRLGVDTVLEGSITSEEGDVVLTAFLTDVENGTVIWGDKMRAPRDGLNLVWIRNDFARQIASQLKLTLDDEETGKTEIAGPRLKAHELYLKGRRLMESDQQLAQSTLQRALIGDPGLAAAHALLARIELDMTDAPGHLGKNRFSDRRDLIRSYIDKALELDSGNADAWLARGMLVLAEGDPVNADEWFKRAIEIDATLSEAHKRRVVSLWVRGYLSNAITAGENFRTRDPLNVGNIGNLVDMYIHAGRAEEATLLLDTLETIIGGEVEARLQEAKISLAQGNVERAITALESGRELDPAERRFSGVSEQVFLTAGRFDLVLEQDARWHHGRAYVGLGREGEAREYVNQALFDRPDDPRIIEDWLFVQNFLGRDKMIRAFAIQRWPDPKEAVDTFGFLYLPSPVHLIASAFHPLDENGNPVPLDSAQSRYARELMQVWNERLTALQARGWDGPSADFERANYSVMRADADAALSLLKKAVDAGYRDPFLERYAAFQALRDRPSFKALLGTRQQATNETVAETD